MRVRIKVYLETIIIIQQRKQIVLKMKKSTKKVKENTAASRQTEDGAIKEITPKKRKKGRYILIYLAIKPIIARYILIYLAIIGFMP